MPNDRSPETTLVPDRRERAWPRPARDPDQMMHVLGTLRRLRERGRIKPKGYGLMSPFARHPLKDHQHGR